MIALRTLIGELMAAHEEAVREHERAPSETNLVAVREARRALIRYCVTAQQEAA